MNSSAVSIFARAPWPGKAKTRLIPLLGPRGAAELHAALIGDTLRKVDALAGRVTRYFFLAGRRLPRLLSRAGYVVVRQRGVGLGARLENAFRKLFRHHPCAAVIGTDSPLLSPRLLREALRELRVCDAVLGPCPDGGYYLIGLRRVQKGLLRGVRWGGRWAFRDTLRNLLRARFSCAFLEPLEDVDTPKDLRRLQSVFLRSRAACRLAPTIWRLLNQLPPEVDQGRRQASRSA
jgi:rSAM/selenodomain-associated transferase 1